MRHLAVIVVVLCAVFVNAFAQNRGSARYVPPEDFDGESTRAPRTAGVRGTGLRRAQRPAQPVEVPEEETYEQPESVRTVGRRIPQRTSPRQVVPPPPPPLPALDLPLEPPAPKEAPETPEGTPQGPRRRRQKKRRKPKTVVPNETDNPNPELPRNRELNYEPISSNVQPSEEFQGNPQPRNPPVNYSPENPAWGSNPSEEQPPQDTPAQQYFRPQPSTNRLPVDNTGKDEYRDPSGAANAESSDGYASKEFSSLTRNRGSYVPVLNPVRVPAEGDSRLPPENYPREALPSDENIPPPAQGNRYPSSNEQPLYNTIPEQNIQPPISVRGHPEDRLPEEKRPLVSPEYGSTDANAEDEQPEESERDSTPSNRLLTPTEIEYDPSYTEYSHAPQRAAAARESSREPKNTVQSISHRRGIETKPQIQDNEAGYDRRQSSQYRPPIQRAGSRYVSDDGNLDAITRTQQQPPAPSSRSRSSSRYTPAVDPNQSERTRDSTRRPSSSYDDSAPSRTRSTSESQSTSRGPQRHVPESVPGPSRTSSRRQPAQTHAVRNAINSVNPVDEAIKNDYRSQPNTPSTYHQPPTNVDEETELEKYPIRNTLRSRPQYEIRDSEPVNSYEEPSENPNAYNDEYQVPRQPPRANRRPPLPVQPHAEQPRPQYHSGSSQNSRSRQSPQYQAPQNARSRQPQHDRQQDPRGDSRQDAPRARPEGRSRQEPESPRPTKASKFRCPDAYGFFADPVQCDKYYECRNGTAEEFLCSDGLAFNDISAPKFVRCDSLRDVDCQSRPELQEPQPSKNCPRRFGLFAHESDCTKFWNCVDGTATEVQCPPGLTYHDALGTCDWADLVEKSCKSEDLLGFTCPEPTAYDLQDGVYTSYPHPDNCQLHYICIKGSDGQRRPRLLTCNEGLVFDAKSAACARPENVPGCEDFYGPVEPKKKPARQPPPRQPEPEEELYEEPTPKPRRRGSSNRRTRN